LSWSTWTLSVGVDHRPLAGLVGLPPVGHQGAVAVVAGVERADAVVLGVGGDRLLQVAGADVVDGALLPGLDLATVDGQLAGAQAQAEGAEAAAGLDGGELAVVADQHHLGARPLGVAEQGGELSGGDHGGLVHHQHRPRIQLDPAVLEVEQQPVDGAGVAEAFVGQADGGDAGGRGAVDLVVGQLKRLPGQAQRPGLAAAGPADHHGDAIAALGEVADHRCLVLASGLVSVEDLADQLGPHHRAALTGPPGGAVDQVPLKGQQLRRGEPLRAQAPVAADPDGSLLEEPVGGRLYLGEHLLSARRDWQALGERVHHVRPGESGRLSGQSVRAGQRVQRGVQLCPAGWTPPSTRADLSELALAHPLLR
jgi:hypothetical protein